MKEASHTEKRHVIVYGYTRKEISGVLKHFVKHLPEYIRMTIESELLFSRIILTGKHEGIALLRFNMNRLQQLSLIHISEPTRH